MKRKFKSIVALIAAAVMVFSAFVTVSAEEQTKWVLQSTIGNQDANVNIVTTWLNGNNTFNVNANTSLSCKTSVHVTGLANTTKLDELANYTVVGTVTPVDEYRYRILPLGTGTSANTSQSFADLIPNFADGYISFDAGKGSSYWDEVDNNKNIVDFMIGFARVDHSNKNNKVSGQFMCHPTDIVWVSIADLVAELPPYASTNTWADVKRNISVKISDIFANGTHKKIHGTEAEQPTVTAENANAFILGQQASAADTYLSSKNILYYNDIAVEMKEEAPTETSFALEGNLTDGVVLSGANADADTITPVVITAYYKENALVAAIPDHEFSVESGKTNTKTYTIDNSYDYDKVRIFVIESFDTVKPLCANFES